MNEEKLGIICQKLMISRSTAKAAVSRITDLAPLEKQLREAKTFNDAFRVVVEAPIGTHVRIDAISKALGLCVRAADYRLLHDRIGRSSAQADELIRHMFESWDPSTEMTES